MSFTSIPDIPRILVAFAQYSGTFVYLIVFAKSRSKLNWVKIQLLVLVGFIFFHEAVKRLPVEFWLLGMFASACLTYFFFKLFTDMTVKERMYYAAFVFLVAEFTQSLGWQMYYFMFGSVTTVTLGGGFFFFIYYGLMYTLLGTYNSVTSKGDHYFLIGKKEVTSMLVVVITTFLISNISFLNLNTPFSGRGAQEVYFIRTLINFAGLLWVTLHKEHTVQSQVQDNLKSIEGIMYRQYELYEQSKENLEIVHQKYHDMKHQLQLIQSETSEERKNAYIKKLEEYVDVYLPSFDTGNYVLDSVLLSKGLTCHDQNIQISCVIDGKLLDFMDEIDICSVFGNAIDNAIESVKLISNLDKRLIRVKVFQQKEFLIIRFENYYENKLKYNKGELITTKKNKEFHGYGIKSLRYTTEKYNGSFSFHTENNWFTILMLFPINEKK